MSNQARKIAIITGGSGGIGAAVSSDAAVQNIPVQFQLTNLRRNTIMSENVTLVTGASSGFGLMAARAPAPAGNAVHASMRETEGRSAPVSLMGRIGSLSTLASRQRMLAAQPGRSSDGEQAWALCGSAGGA
jgi:NAD(P)-dependent dehydrogenase (short-subunit alcohol dehydrogenase family)